MTDRDRRKKRIEKLRRKREQAIADGSRAREMPEEWRWNVHPAWECYTTMFQHSRLLEDSVTEFEKRAYVRSVLIFGAISIESFINWKMSEFMKEEGEDRQDIVDYLRSPGPGFLSLEEKVRKWTEEMAGGAVSIPPSCTDHLFELIQPGYKLRNKVVHPSWTDHSHYSDLERVDTDEFVGLVAELIGYVCEALEDVIPYWTLGWNFVGFNFNDLEPCIQGDLYLLHSLRNMGFLSANVAFDFDRANDWMGSNMTSVAGMEKLREMLASYPFDAEPPTPGPRLTRRWWDRALLSSDRGEDQR